MLSHPFFVWNLYICGGQLTLPFLVMMLVIVFTTWGTSKAKLPDIEGTREEDSSSDPAAVAAKPKRSIWSFPHLKYGVITIFFYVEIEVGIGNNMNLHVMDLASQDIAVTPALVWTDRISQARGNVKEIYDKGSIVK